MILNNENFLNAIDFIIDQLEGGGMLVKENRRKPNGTTYWAFTKWGIDSDFHPGVNVIELTKEQAIEIYNTEYRQQSHFDELPFPLGMMMLDCYINMSRKICDKLYEAFHEKLFNLDTFMLARIFFYLEIVNDNSSKEEDLHGWLNRCRLLYDFVDSMNEMP
jgi:hydroxymethylpyrimidine pyrophosphatase-like HAD family hydrolase